MLMKKKENYMEAGVLEYKQDSVLATINTMNDLFKMESWPQLKVSGRI